MFYFANLLRTQELGTRSRRGNKEWESSESDAQLPTDALGSRVVLASSEYVVAERGIWDD